MPAESYEVEAALDLLSSRPLVVLTGAGLSTDSGIPDYRGPGSRARMPMTFQEFVATPTARQRYWARSHIGWARMRGAAPNIGHHALTEIAPDLLITQNVDGLHEAAGSRGVVTLHGRISDVICLACRAITSRADLQTRMQHANPGWIQSHGAVEIRPDGDVALEETDGFVIPSCTDCGGVLKPDVVFFGENAPAHRVSRCYEAVESAAAQAGAMLVAGSSLTVMSGLRFVKRAAKVGLPVVIVNRGATRGDVFATHKVEVGCSDFLADLADSRHSIADSRATMSETRRHDALSPA